MRFAALALALLAAGCASQEKQTRVRPDNTFTRASIEYGTGGATNMVFSVSKVDGGARVCGGYVNVGGSVNIDESADVVIAAAYLTLGEDVVMRDLSYFRNGGRSSVVRLTNCRSADLPWRAAYEGLTPRLGLDLTSFQLILGGERFRETAEAVQAETQPGPATPSGQPIRRDKGGWIRVE